MLWPQTYSSASARIDHWPCASMCIRAIVMAFITSLLLRFASLPPTSDMWPKHGTPNMFFCSWGIWEASEHHLICIWEPSESHLRGIWEASECIWKSSGRYLRCICDASGKHLGDIWDTSDRHLGHIWEAPGASMRLQDTKIDAPLSYNARSSLEELWFYNTFLRAGITTYDKLQWNMLPDSADGLANYPMAHYQHRENPYMRMVWLPDTCICICRVFACLIVPAWSNRALCHDVIIHIVWHRHTTHIRSIIWPQHEIPNRCLSK